MIYFFYKEWDEFWTWGRICIWTNVHGDEFVWDEFVGDKLLGDESSRIRLPVSKYCISGANNIILHQIIQTSLKGFCRLKLIKYHIALLIPELSSHLQCPHNS